MSYSIIRLSAHLKKQRQKKQLPIIFLAVSPLVLSLDPLQKQQIKMLDVLSKALRFLPTLLVPRPLSKIQAWTSARPRERAGKIVEQESCGCEIEVKNEGRDGGMDEWMHGCMDG